MKRFVCLLLICALLAGCSGPAAAQRKSYDATFLTLFDTVTTIRGFADSQEEFTEVATAIHDELLRYHQLFDIYNDYEGVNNLKTVNDRAGEAPVVVDEAIIDLLSDCKNYASISDGKVNVAMGGVLYLWHEARNDGMDDPRYAELPDQEALEAAAEHWDLDAVIIDTEASTVYISDPLVRLDVGAVAKGWSVQRVCENAPEGMLISVGGNVFATGPKDKTGTPWVVGVQDPDGGSDYLHTIYLTRGSIVTSGDYQRYYVVDGKVYHHIIDPDTLYPSEYWRSVTIVCEDSGLADALSTALFVLPLEEGRALLDSCGAHGMWVDMDGNAFYSSEFEALIRT